MAKRKYIQELGDKTLVDNMRTKAQSFQAGGGAPEAQGQPQGAPQGGGQVNPEEIAMAYAQAKQAQDGQGMAEAAVMFMDAVVMPQMQQAQGAMRGGGETKELQFDENGEIK